MNHVGPLYVTSPVVDEVNEIDDENELLALPEESIETENREDVAGSESRRRQGRNDKTPWG